MAARRPLVLINGVLRPLDMEPLRVGRAIFDQSALTADRNFALPDLAGTIALIGQARERVTSDRTYYVRSDGNDSNNGLADTAGGAFLTIPKAWDVLSSLDLSIYAGNIIVRSGTYTGAINGNKAPVGGSSINIIGDTTTPANVHLNVTGTCMDFTAPLPCRVTVEGFKFSFAGSSVSAVNLAAAGNILLRNNEYAGGSTGFRGAVRTFDKAARITMGANNFFTGNMACMLQAGYGVVELSAVPYTLVGTPAWSWVGVSSSFQGFVKCDGASFSGAATGVRYAATSGGGIFTNGAGATFLPGDTGGSVTSPGWYA